ncbi:hypothetical protein LTR86_008620 [Recurvomyces mirabilis]|nr:hypothetical protein LTR86_008620 [Recurvomyces mirabilis]
MPYRNYSRDIVPLSRSSRSRDPYAYAVVRRRSRSRSLVNDRRRQRDKAWERSVDALRDRGARDYVGDLGWTLAYATAWLYKFLVDNRTEVVDAIDRAREVETVTPETPYLLFNLLDQACFDGKLAGMVYLRWKALSSNVSGCTSAQGVIPHITRICIELNKSEFEDDDGDIDDLLDALIHQMIHAYFVVACGKVPEGATNDDRLLDGLHFGVIVYTIRDITRQCREDRLELEFYAARRRTGFGASRSRKNKFISMMPQGNDLANASRDQKTHCNLDNRGVRWAQIKNWQVNEFSVTYDLGLVGKGDFIHDYRPSGAFERFERRTGPASSTYIELIWDDRRVIVSRKHALSYSSIKRPLMKNNKMELKIPECSIHVFGQIYDFFNRGSYYRQIPAKSTITTSSRLSRQGPPTLVPGRNSWRRSNTNLVVHLETFKVAQSMEFEELEAYVLRVLWDSPVTDDDPIAALKVLYNENDNSGPIHAELHKWARKFLGRVDQGTYHGDGLQYSRGYAGTTNLDKIKAWYPEEFKQLYYRNMAFKDDIKLVEAECEKAIRDSYYGEGFGVMSPLGIGGGITEVVDTVARRKELSMYPTSRQLARPRSWSSPYDALVPLAARGSMSTLDSLDSIVTPRSFDNIMVPRRSGGMPRRLPLGEIGWRQGGLAIPGMNAGMGVGMGLGGRGFGQGLGLQGRGGMVDPWEEEDDDIFVRGPGFGYER